MDEIYWITRLDNIQGAFIGVLVISVVFIQALDKYLDKELKDEKEDKE